MRQDPIGDKYYRPLRTADSASEWIFWLVALMSIMAVLIDSKIYPRISGAIQIVFVMAVIANFILGVLIRLYWSPRAEDKRREELLSNAFQVSLTHERTQNYYNNEEEASVRRLAAALLENSFFSKSVISEMAVAERIRVCAYFIIWLLAVLNRTSELVLIGVIAQVLFSENLIAKLIRLEWLRGRFERSYGELYNLIQGSNQLEDDTFRSKVINMFGLYETSKAYGGIVLSSKVFFRRNDELSAEWTRIKRALCI